jgi:hypothetical protein
MREVGMFGIEDPQVWGAYLLCILSALFCVGYGLLNWNKGEEKVHPEDQAWVEGERKVEETL